MIVWVVVVQEVAGEIDKVRAFTSGEKAHEYALDQNIHEKMYSLNTYAVEVEGTEEGVRA